MKNCHKVQVKTERGWPLYTLPTEKDEHPPDYQKHKYLLLKGHIQRLIMKYIFSFISHHQVQSFSPVQLFVTARTVTRQAPLSMGFCRQNTGMDCHFLLQGIFQTQGSNLGLQHCRQILTSEPQGRPSTFVLEQFSFKMSSLSRISIALVFPNLILKSSSPYSAKAANMNLK